MEEDFLDDLHGDGHIDLSLNSFGIKFVGALRAIEFLRLFELSDVELDLVSLAAVHEPSSLKGFAGIMSSCVILDVLEFGVVGEFLDQLDPSSDALLMTVENGL